MKCPFVAPSGARCELEEGHLGGHMGRPPLLDPPQAELTDDFIRSLLHPVVKPKVQDWTPPIKADSPALEGLDRETLDAIRGSVTAEQIATFVGVLTAQPQKAETIRQLLVQRGAAWFPVKAKRDTQLRRIRTIRDAAVVAGYPVTTTNRGYWLGSWPDVYDGAERAERFAYGALKRARVLKQTATQMRESDG